MEIVVYCALFALINAFVGSFVLVALDTPEKAFYEWYKEDPTGGVLSFLILEFWPVMAFIILRYTRQKGK